MKIVVDLQPCQSGSRLGGIGRYSLALASAMMRNPRGHEYWVVLNGLLREPMAKVRRDLMDLVPPDRILDVDFWGPVAEADPANRFRFDTAARMREQFIEQLRPDVVHVSSLFEGLFEETVTSVGLATPAERVAVTLYDLIPLVERGIYLNESFKYDWYMSKVASLRRAGILLSISEFSRQEAINVLGLPPDQIVNISSAVDPKFRPLDIATEEAAALRASLNIRGDFLLFTGSLDQRKNHAMLIKAFAALPPEVRDRHQLVMVGNGWDDAYRLFRGLAESEGMNPANLVFPGHISDLELVKLYNLCKLFVFPSLREGFGLPVLEAMSCGAPAIGSNVTSIPEVIGRSDALFDPTSRESITSKMHDVLTNDAFLDSLKRGALRQSANFSWDRSAAVALDAFESRVKARPPHKRRIPDVSVAPHGDLVATLDANSGLALLPESQLEALARVIARNDSVLTAVRHLQNGTRGEVRIGVVTTWNTRCGIATYSIPVINAMPAPVFIFAPTACDLVQPDSDNVDRCWTAGQADDLVELAAAIERRMIDALVVQFNYGFYRMEALAEFLNRQVDVGRAVFVILHSTQDPPSHIIDSRLADARDALARCTVLVHQADDVARLAILGLAENVHHIPLGMHEDRASDVSLPDLAGSKVVATYGFALPNKGLTQLIEATHLASRKIDNLHLLLVTAEFPAPESKAVLESVRAKAREFGIDDRVTVVSDYLSNDVSLGYLKHADLIVIPYQSTTESSSGSARMALAAGPPVAVTPLSMFDDMRSVVETLPGTGPDEIATGIVSLLDRIARDDTDLRAQTERARVWVKAHGFGAIGRYLFTGFYKASEDQGKSLN